MEHMNIDEKKFTENLSILVRLPRLSKVVVISDGVLLLLSETDKDM